MELINWNKLEHAYGNASDIPGLLAQLEEYPECEDYESEPFFTLWSSLCHQGDIYNSSYAAVPHIISLIEKHPQRANYNYFLLPVCIEIARLKGNGAKLNIEMERNYIESIKLMAKLAGESPLSDPIMANVLAAAVAVAKGSEELAEVILELTPNTIKEFKEWQES
ncbi:hypothetical protein ACFOND_14490 [Reinekea marina]|uniref:Immunity protein 30 of polymorphic toxin system n=2 Tax=Reinekea marina TaxID=1310421 RepID=A0ABV7WWJ6_9GAMM